MNFIVFESNNFGDAITKKLWELCLEKNISLNQINTYEDYHYLTTGSILSMANKKSTVYGTGFVSETSDLGGWIHKNQYNFIENDTLKEKPLSICAVRGPKTRNKILRFGVDCPEIYGDPILLLPALYRKQNTVIKDIVGIIPHYCEKNNINLKTLENNLLERGFECLIIDIEIGDNYKKIIDEVLKCKYIISSSLHGLMLGIIYKKLCVHINFSNSVAGNNFKFFDFMESIKIYRYNVVNEYTTEVLNYYNIINVNYKVLEDVSVSFLNACPFLSEKRKHELECSLKSFYYVPEESKHLNFLHNLTFLNPEIKYKNNFEDSKIPKLLHIIWIDDEHLEETASNTCSLLQENIYKWMDLMPNWKILLWTKFDITNTEFSQDILNTFNACKTGKEKSHILRYAILDKMGGVYLDADILPQISLDPILSTFSHERFLICNDSNITEKTNKIKVGFLGCVKNHQIIKSTLQFLLKTNYNVSNSETLFCKALKEYNGHDTALVLPSLSFYSKFKYRFGIYKNLE